MAAKLICDDCVTDRVLSAWVEDNGEEATCAYCLEEGVCCQIDAVAKEIDKAIRRYYKIAPEEGHVVADSDNIAYYAEGDSAEDIIHGIVDSADAAADMVALLSASEERDVRDGDDAFYDGTLLEHVESYPDGFLEVWESFEQRLKHEVRYFDERGRAMLGELFGDLPDFGGGQAIVTLSPEEKDLRLYRARIIVDESEREEFVRDPARHVGPPPPDLATAGRMNPAGIPAFYGAFSADVAVAEIRPPVGSLVAVGEFSLLRPLRLLDMSFLPFAYHEESMFSAKYDEARSKVRFLEVFHRRISRPILPNDETLAYLPTQAVAAYVANVMNLDGIIYSSTQVGAEDESTGDQLPRELCNVVLFGTAALVERTPAPPKPPEEDLEPAWFSIIGPSNAAPVATGAADQPDAGTPKADEPEPEQQAKETPPAEQAAAPEPSGLSENGTAATLRIKRDPKLVRIRAVKVETSPLFAHLYEDGRVLIDDFDRDE